MKTPAFWYGPPSATATWLSPLAHLYAHLGKWHRQSKSAQESNLPVICLGNLVSGGSGKTPTAIALLNLLKKRNVFLAPAFLTRGYRGKVRIAERVDESRSSAMWGDEALLLTRHAPTFVSPNRYQGALLMEQQGCDAILMDDGLQHYSLKKDVSFALVDGLMGFGNLNVVPAGPLRQPLADGFALTDAFILIGDDTKGARAVIPHDKPIFTAQLNLADGYVAPSGPYVAFCGIGFPEKFNATLRKAGIEVVGWHAFGDHHAYTITEIDELIHEAKRKNARLITTEKDFARLGDLPNRTLIDTLPVEIIFDEPNQLAAYIAAKTAHKIRK